MIRGALLSSLVTKEVRALWPAWLASLAAMTADAVVDLGPFRGLGIAAFFFGSATLGALSIGHEYQHRTMTWLLSQPARRAHFFLVKLGVLVPMLLTIGAVAAVVGFPRVHLESQRLWFAWLPVLYVLCVAPWLTMVFRSALAGAIFTLSLPGAALTVGQLLYVAAYQRVLPEHAVITILWRASIVLCAVGAVMSWRTFMRLEAIDGPASDLSLQWLRWPGTAAAGAPALMKGDPIWLLIKKEFRLQQMSLVVGGLYVVGHLGAASLRPMFSHSKDVFDALTVFYVLLISLFIGSVASAEERQLGTLEWQTLLPVASSKQWAVKVGFVLSLALLLGLGLPLLTSFNPDITRRLWPQLAFSVIAIAIAGLYVSSACASGLWSMLISLPAVFGVLSLVMFLRVRLELLLARTVNLALIRFDSALEPLMTAALLVLLLWFALANHRSADRSARRIWIQGLWLTGCVTAGMVISVLVAR